MDVAERIGLLKPRRTWDNPSESIGERMGCIRGKYTCWQPTGRALAAWNDVGPKIKEFLDKFCTWTSSSPAILELYMIGKTEQSAVPTVLICFDDKPTRKRIRKLIEEHGFLHNYPGMTLGDAPKLRTIVRMAGGDDAGDAVLTTSTSSSENLATVYTDGDDQRILGRRLIIQRGTNRRIATGGPIVWINEKPYQLTVGHVLEDEDKLPTLDSDQALSFDECSFDGDSDQDDSESALDQDVPSGGSRTPEDLLSVDSDEEDARESGDSSCFASQQATSSSDTEELLARFDPLIKLERKGTPDGEGPTDGDTAPGNDLRPAPFTQRPLGNIFLSSTDSMHPNLDYALVEVDWTRSGDIVKVREYLDNCVKMSLAPDHRLDDVAVSVWTYSQGVVCGKLSASASYMRVPDGEEFQEVFLVRMDTALSRGGCGAAVINPSTGHFYGHIVAGTPGTGLAYIVPSAQIFRDIQERLGHEVKLVPPTASNPDQHQADPAAVYKGLSKPALVKIDAAPVLAGGETTIHRFADQLKAGSFSNHPGHPTRRSTYVTGIDGISLGNNGGHSINLGLVSGDRVRVFREPEGRYLKILRTKETDDNGGLLREIEYFRLDQDPVVPLYTIDKTVSKMGFRFQIRNAPDPPRIYELRTRRDAFRFQELFTGYRVLDSFKNTMCNFKYSGKLVYWRRPVVEEGFGEIQFWREDDCPTEHSQTSSLVGMQKTELSVTSGSTSSSGSSSDRRGFFPTNQSAPTDIGVIIRKKYSPFLVAFLQEGARVKMFKMSITNLRSQQGQGGTVFLSPTQNGHFTAEILAIKESEITSWNICALGTSWNRQKGTTEEVKFRHVSISFQSNAEASAFEKRLRDMQLVWRSTNDAFLRQVGVHSALSSQLPALSRDASSQTSSVDGDPPKTPAQLPNFPDWPQLDLDFPKKDGKLRSLGGLYEEDEDNWLATEAQTRSRVEALETDGE